MHEETKTFYEFDDFRVEPQERRLLRGEKQLEVTPKIFDMLLMFLRSGGRLLTKDELMAGLWPDSYVDEANLKVNIATLRKLLHQYQNRNPENNKQFIETIPKTGYRFLRGVRVVGESGASEGPLLQTQAETAAPNPVIESGPQAQDPPGSSWPGTFQRAISHYRTWIFWGAAIAGAGTFLDLIFLHPHAGQLLRDVPGATVSGICIFYYLWSVKRNLGTEPASNQVTAFRGLVPFEAADAKRFFGREIETTAIVEMVTHGDFQFGVLYGESGCGKTSLIRAGLIPRLEAIGYIAVHCRSYKDPLQSVITACRRQTRLAPGKDEAPTDYLNRASQKSAAGLVVVCDQFEEFYVNFVNRQERTPFFQLLSQCTQSSFVVPVKFLFTVRSDFLHFIISAFDEHLPDVLVASRRRYHLQQFDQDQAVDVIEKSVCRAEWPFEIGLARRVARDLTINGMVLPSELQIVGQQLQRRRIFTLEQYRRAGAKDQLVHEHLQDVIKMTRERETAQLVLRCLISDEDTRLTLPLAEIHRRVQRSERTIGRILKLFAQERLIREIQDEDGCRYELMHEYLIAKINQATGKIMDATQRANRYFRQYLSNYMVDKRTRIPVTKLWLIHRHSDLERDEQQRRLVRKSWWQGLLWAGILAIGIAALAVATAAWLSITENWEEVLLNDGHTAGVHRAVFSPDGRLLVSCGEDGKVIVWDFARRLKLATLNGHSGAVNALIFSPDGKWFATGGYDHRVILWNAATFMQERMLPDAGGRIGTLAISPNRRLLAVATDAERTILWDTTTWQELFVLPISSQYNAAFFSADSRHLFVAGSGWWNLATHRATSKMRDNSTWAAVSPDNHFMVSVVSNGDVLFEDLLERRLLSNVKAHQDNGRAVAYSPDGRLVATGTDNIVLWDAITRHKIVRLTYPSIVWTLAFSPDGRWLVSTHGDGSILVWDPMEHELIANLNGHSGPVRTVAYSPDGRRIASAGEDDSIIVWDAQLKQKQKVFLQHKDKVTGVAFSPDSKFLASFDFSRVLSYNQLDSTDDRPKWSTEVGNSSVGAYCLAGSPDGRWIATAQAVYSARDGTQVARLGPASWTLAFSPDSRWLAQEHGEFLEVWDSRTWTKTSYRSATSLSLMGVSFSPDGKLLVTGDDQGPVRLWQVDPFRELAMLGSHRNRVKSLVFSPDGRQIASAGDDHAINLWDVKRRKRISTIGIHASPVLSLAFSPDGKRLISGEHDNSVRMYTRHHSLWGHTLD